MYSRESLRIRLTESRSCSHTTGRPSPRLPRPDITLTRYGSIVITRPFTRRLRTAALGALPSTLDFNLAIVWIIFSRFCFKPISAASRSMSSTVILGISGDYIEKYRKIRWIGGDPRMRPDGQEATAE